MLLLSIICQSENRPLIDSPILHRFANADVYEDTGSGVVGTNMFAYCNNNPVMYVDPEGKNPVTTLVAVFAVLLAIVGGLVGYKIVKSNGYSVYDGWDFWKYILGGIVIGGAAGAALGYIGGAFFSASGLITSGAVSSSIYSMVMEKVRYLGNLGESLAGITKNTTRIPSLNGTANYRIPDILDRSLKIIGDVKYVSYLSYTEQLKDFMSYANKYGYKFILYIKPDTSLSKPLKELIDAGKIVVMFITEDN